MITPLLLVHTTYM